MLVPRLYDFLFYLSQSLINLIKVNYLFIFRQVNISGNVKIIAVILDLA